MTDERTIQVRVPTDMRARLIELADVEGVPAAEWVREAVRQRLEWRPPFLSTVLMPREVLDRVIAWMAAAFPQWPLILEDGVEVLGAGRLRVRVFDEDGSFVVHDVDGEIPEEFRGYVAAPRERTNA